MNQSMYISEYSTAEIENISKEYSHDNEILTSEESTCNANLKELNAQKEEIETEKSNLKRVKEPGNTPDYKSFIKPVYSILAPIWGVALVAVFLLHCVIWIIKLVFDISWDTWGWTKDCFIYGLALIITAFVIVSLIYGIVHWGWNMRYNRFIAWKEESKRLTKLRKNILSQIELCQESISNIKKNRQMVLAHALRLRLSLPIKSIDDNTFPMLRNRFFQMLDKKSNIDNELNLDTKFEHSLNYYNDKIDLFYRFSIESEAQSNQVLSIFNNASKKIESPRDKIVIPEIADDKINQLVAANGYYSEKSLDSYIDEFNELLSADTSGFFLKHSNKLLEKQVNGLKASYDAAKSVYDSHLTIAQKAKDLLALMRLLAYRNIYLGAELLNIVRDNAGGGKLSTVHDSIGNVSVPVSINIQVAKFDVHDSLNYIMQSGLDSAFTLLENVMKDKQMRKFVTDNPKYAALALAGTAAIDMIESMFESAISAWEQRNARIKRLIKSEEQIINNMQNLVDSYLDNISSVNRAFEIAQAIKKANLGFETIYRPIYIKIFVDKSPKAITMEELKNLTLAIGEYKKISDSKI